MPKYSDPSYTDGVTANGTDRWPVLRSGANPYITPAYIWAYIQALTGNMAATARTAVRKNSTGSVFERRRLNFIEGSGVTLTVADDSGNEEVDITIDASGGGSSTGLVARYHLTSDLTLNSASATRFNATIQDYDPGSDVTTGASWVYTVPTTAWYEVKLTFALLIANGNAWQNDKGAEANLKMNAGTYVGMMRYERTNSADGTGQFLHMGGSIAVSCTAGDTLYVEIYNGTGATRKMEADSAIEIYKVT